MNGNLVTMSFNCIKYLFLICIYIGLISLFIEDVRTYASITLDAITSLFK